MLRGIRKVSSNWVGKTIMYGVVALLAISFAIWGIGDIFRGFGQSTVATVGNTEISVEQFRQIYTDRVQQIGQQIGRPLTPDQIRAAGLDRQIVGQIVADAAIDQRARDLGLGITDAEMARQIREIPAFQGLNGQFDPRLFEQRIRNAGYNERRFVEEQRRFTVRQQLTESLSGMATAPKTALQALNQFQNERRAIEYVVLGAAQAGDIPAPTPEDLSKFYEAHKSEFRAPEYRKLVVLSLTPTEVAQWMQISDEDAKKYFDERAGQYTTTGRRQIQQIIFPSADEAKAAKAKLDGGMTFEDLAKERGLTEKEIDLGLVGKTGALAPAVAEAAFALPEGGISDPVASRVGTALVRVVKIEPDSKRTFEEAKDEVRKQIATERTRAEISDKHDKIEDERAAGATIAEVAQKVGLTATEIEAVDRSGLDATGARALGLPTGADIIPTAFTIDVGVEADAIRTPDGGYIWVDVVGVTPARERTLEEVKTEVEARWRNEQIAERLRTKAAEMVEKLKGGAPFAEVASGLTVATAADLQRSSATHNHSHGEGLSPAAIDAAFRVGKDGAGTAPGNTLDERVVFRVTNITVPEVNLETPEAKALQDQLRTSLSNDLLGQYVAQVERELGARINQEAVRRVVGGETN